MKYIDIISIVLLLIGGLNWGLVGLFDFNLVTALFGTFPLLVKTIYGLVGLSAVYGAYRFLTKAGCCNNNKTV